jgi:hypothetical protein
MSPGIKTGGRRKGSKNKRKAIAELMSDVTVQAVQAGETPLEYMLRVMRDQTQEYPRRDDMAKASAPYVHSKLGSTEVKHSGTIDGNVRFLIEAGPPSEPVADDAV